MTKAYVGRQPICDKNRNVVGYELLFRRGEDDATPTGEEMTSRVMVHACIDFGLHNIVGDRTAYVNMTRPFLTGELPNPFPKHNTVLEVLEDVVADDAVLAGVHRAKLAGYRIALDDFTFAPHNSALLGLADVVKIDISMFDREQWPTLVATAHNHDCLVVAERVETPNDVLHCLRAKFDLLQGFALARPEFMSSGVLDSSGMLCLRILARLSQPDVEMDEIHDMIRHDPGISYRVLRAANSAASAISRPLTSVREALVLLGLRQLQSWIAIMVAAKMDALGEAATELVIRARMCELLARHVPETAPETAFTTGLVSKLDTVLGRPIEQIVRELPLHPEIEAAIVDRSGRLGRVLDCVEAYERGEVLDLEWAADVPIADVYLSAVGWSLQATGKLADEEPVRAVAAR